MTKSEKKDEIVGTEEKYEALVETAPDAIFTLDLLGRFTFVNPAAERISGYGKEELVGKHFRELLPAKYIPACLNVFQKALRGQPTSPLEIEMITKEGEKVPLELLGRPVKRGRKVVEIIAIGRDIAERKRGEREIKERRLYLEGVLTAAPDAIVTLDSRHRIVEWNPGAERLFGYSREEVIGQSLDDLITNPATYEEAAGFTQIVLGGKDVHPVETVRYRKDGSPVDVIVAGSPILVGNELIGVGAVYTDITQRKRAEEQAQQRLTQITTLHKVSEIINATLDLKEVFQRVVEELSNTFGYRLVGIYLLEEDALRLQANIGYNEKTTIESIPLERGVVGRVARTSEPAFIPDVSRDPDYIPAYPEIKSEICVPVKSGETLLGTLNVECDEKRPLTHDDLHLLFILSSHIGVAIENARLYEETQRLAITDGLTGLYNLRYFYEALEKEVQRSKRYHGSVSLIILDIDDFKAYNELYGHLAGDDLLMELAQLMSKVTRRTDTLARYGGEEFVIILPETETEAAESLAGRLQEEAREYRFSIQDGQTIGQITISLGVATYPHHANTTKALVDAADTALLVAKRAGKNRICVYGEKLTQLDP